MTNVLVERETLVLVEEARQELLIEERERVQILTEAKQGPRGAQGIPGPAGGATTVTVGAAPLSGHSAVALDAAGLLIKADCTNLAHLGAVVGLLTDAYAPGDQAVVQTAFTVEHVGWTWAPGPVFVGTAGQLTQSLPVGAAFSQVVAHALAATLVLVDVQPPISLA